MTGFNNAMEIFKLLNKSNCRECNEGTCLAFAGAVFIGRRSLDECPYIDRETIARYRRTAEMTAEGKEAGADDPVAALQQRLADIDLSEAAERVGGRFHRGKLTLKTLGKDFSVDTQGRMSADIHIHQWIAIPVLSTIIESKGTPVSGRWVPFRELPNGSSRNGLFVQRGEKPLKKVADTYTDLFEDMIHLFNGRQVEEHYQSDISLVLHPLPRVPMLICYWRPDEGLASSLNIFFDDTAEDHLSIDGLFALATGLVVMLEKLSLRHGI